MTGRGATTRAEVRFKHAGEEKRIVIPVAATNESPRQDRGY